MIQCKEGKISSTALRPLQGPEGSRVVKHSRVVLQDCQCPCASFWSCLWHLAEAVFQDREPAREGANALSKAPFPKHRRK